MSRKDIVFGVLGAFFVTNAIVAEMIGGKIIYVAPEWVQIFLPGMTAPARPAMSVGVLPWPIVFVATDLINEYFGRRGVRRLTMLTVVMIAYAWGILVLTQQIPAASFSGIKDAAYNEVFGQSQWIIVGSILAFLLSQLLDVTIFHALRTRTGKAMLWLRSTGSTVISQIIDTVVVLYIGLKIPKAWTWEQYWSTAIPNYSVKLLIAVLMTPLIYAGHAFVEWYLGKSTAEQIAEEAARQDS